MKGGELCKELCEELSNKVGKGEEEVGLYRM